MSNVEGSNSIDFNKFKRQSDIRRKHLHFVSDFILRYSAVGYSAVLRFAVRPRGVPFEGYLNRKL